MSRVLRGVSLAAPLLALASFIIVGAAEKLVARHVTVDPKSNQIASLEQVLANWDASEYQLISDPRSKETLKERKEQCASWSKQYGTLNGIEPWKVVEQDSPASNGQSEWYGVAFNARFSIQPARVLAAFRDDHGRWVLSSLHVIKAEVPVPQAVVKQPSFYITREICD